jgi:hypothetical protein
VPQADKAAYLKYQREWRARRRAEWFADKKCENCGSTDDLELDHRDRNQKLSHKVWSWSKERRDAELAKCQVLCHPCHLAKSQTSGDLIHQAKLTLDDVRDIRRLGGSMRQVDLAERFGIGQPAVSDILNRRTWKYI